MDNGFTGANMKKIFIFAVIALALAALIFAAEEKVKTEEKPAAAYVGDRRCKVCHLATFKAWEKTAHAHAFETLKNEERKNPICIACHTTGYGAGGYGSKDMVVDLSNVQCESCHGPGSLYSRSSVMRERERSEELGLVRIGPETCTRCHNENSPTFRVFDYKEFLKTGTH
jgi:hypothetical protein